jgi:hypothetical protein
VLDVSVVLHVGEVGLTYVNVDPNTLNLSSNGRTIKAVLQLPAGLDPHDIDIASVSVAGQVFANPSPIDYTDENGDGILELVVKFDRQAVQALLAEGDSVPVTITGEVHDVTWFRGTDLIRTIKPRVSQPNGGNYLIAGQSTTLTWDATSSGNPDYDVWLSRDGGETWEVLAAGLGGQQYNWTVTGPGTAAARIRVIAADNDGVMGFDESDGDFTIAAALYAPAPVGDLLASRQGATVTLRWKASVIDPTHGPAASYRILTATEANGPFTQLGVATVDSFVLPGETEPSPIRFYRVTAVNAAGESQ